MLTVTEAAGLLTERLGRYITTDRIRKWIRAGKLPATEVGGSYYIKTADLEKMVKEPDENE